MKRNKLSNSTLLKSANLWLIILILNSCSSSEKLTNKGWDNYKKGNYGKAFTQFSKAKYKEGNHERAYEGLAFVSSKWGNFGKAESYIAMAYSLNPNSPRHTYNYACMANKNGNSNKAMNLLYEIPAKGNFDYYRKLAAQDEDLNTLKSNTKFNRYLSGYRRLKIQPYYGYSSESDGLFNENDLFAVVENQNKIILATDIVQESKFAKWSSDYVVFDYPLTSKLRMSLMDEDVVEHDNLLTVNGLITQTGDFYWKSGNGNSALKVKISDSESSTYTTGTSLPSEVSLGELAVGLGIGAALYYITSSSELDHTSSSTNSYSNSSSTNVNPNNSSFISCSSSTGNPTDLYILSIGTDVEENSSAMDNDAKEIANKLREGCGNRDLFGNVYSKILTNTSASKTNILQALNEIKAKTNEDDIFLLFFSGHGRIDNYTNKFVFCARNGDVTVDEIVKGIDADNCKTILWFDACHAGQAGNDFRNSVDNYIINKQLPNVSILMSSSDYESSWTDVYSNMGFFAKTIIEGLKGAADAGEKNHFISLRELANYIIQIVPQRTNKNNCSYCDNTQHPQILNEGKSFNTRLSEY